jgi:hypothetical protein
MRVWADDKEKSVLTNISFGEIRAADRCSLHSNYQKRKP